MSTLFHQNLVRFLFGQLEAFVLARSLGRVVFAPFIVRLGPDHLRQPDVCFVRQERVKDLHTPPEGADLIMEVVSAGKENRKRDVEEKRAAYAEAAVPEYWIVDPEQRTISVLTLDGATYRVAEVYGDGQQAASVLLPGFCVDVSAAWAAAEA
jgi:Uma2 family endonuclease